MAAGIALATTAAIGAYGYLTITNDAMYKLKKRTKELRDGLDELKTSADTNYVTQTKMFDLSDDYANKLQEQIDLLKESKLSEEESAEIKKKISTYVESLNNALGQEVVSFDETTKKLTFQGEEVDNLTDKYKQLQFEIRKQTWLDAHRDSLKEAYIMLDESRDGIVEATKYYADKIKDIPKEYLDYYERFNGDIERVKKKLILDGTEDDEVLDKNLMLFSGYMELYKQKVQELKDAEKEANKSISNYQAVSESDIESFDRLISGLQPSLKEVTDDIETSAEKLETMGTLSDLLSIALTDKQKAHDETYKSLVQEIEKEQEIYDKNEAIRQKVIEINEERDKGMEEFDTWTAQESHKSLTIDVRYNYINQLTGGGNIVGPSAIRSGGFESFRNSINNSLLNNINSMKSGGFMSGGVTLNASFNINNGNNIDKTVVQGWASSMIDIINEELGGRL